MKKFVIATVLSLTVATSVWAAQISTTETDTNEHRNAMVAHKTTNNNSANAHQQMAEMHKEKIGTATQAKTDKATKSFTTDERASTGSLRSFIHKEWPVWPTSAGIKKTP